MGAPGPRSPHHRTPQLEQHGGRKRRQRPHVVLAALFLLVAQSATSDSRAQALTSTWRSRDGSPSTWGARWDHAMAFNSSTGQTILFGGLKHIGPGGYGVPMSDTWAWDGSSWTNLVPLSSPPPLSGHAMAYDAARDRIVMFGADYDDPSSVFQTWEWDGATWGRAFPANSPTTTGRIVYDSARQRVIFFGGVETWAWDGNDWSRLNTTQAPSNRRRFAMTYDSDRDRVVLIGCHYWWDSCVDGNTWEFDGTDWINRGPDGGPRPASSSAYMAYDSARHRTVLFDSRGGTWEWDGSQWEQKLPGIPKAYPGSPGNAISPGGRAVNVDDNSAMVFDSRRSVALLFGGYDPDTGDQIEPNAAWEYDGSLWQDRTSSSRTPLMTRDSAMAYHEGRGVSVLFGGDHLGRCSDATTVWDGEHWSADPASLTSVRRELRLQPSPRLAHAMAYDHERRSVLLFGGGCAELLDDTWEWDGAWTKRTPSTSPTARALHSMADDPVRGRIVLFGGYPALNDTWEWEGSTWTRMTPATSPPKRMSAVMAYDYASQRVVLFGGVDREGNLLNDTWAWNGNDWTQLIPQASPSYNQLTRTGLVSDPVRQRLVVVFERQIWEWDGVTWEQTTAQAPTPFVPWPAAATYDVARRSMVVFGGHHLFDATTPITWEITWTGS